MPVGHGTRVSLRHHGLVFGLVDQPTSDRHAAGWAHYLPRLAVVAAGANRGRTTGVPYRRRLGGGLVTGWSLPRRRRGTDCRSG